MAVETPAVAITRQKFLMGAITLAVAERGVLTPSAEPELYAAQPGPFTSHLFPRPLPSSGRS